MGNGEWGKGDISIPHSLLPIPHSLPTYVQLLRVPEREGQYRARTVIADALIGRHGHMARDDGDDRQLFGEDSLNFVEVRASAIGFGLAGLLSEQVINFGFPGG